MKYTTKKDKEKMYKPRVYGSGFNPNVILYDCNECCFNVKHGVKTCPNGHRLDWRGKHKYWKSKE
jgi:hypothetical protein